MTNTRTILEQGWKAIQDRFLTTLRTVAAGGDAGEWSSGLRTITGSDYINAATGNRYRGAFNRAMIANALGRRLDRRVATACQIERMGYPAPAAHGIASHATILTPIALKQADDEEDAQDTSRPNVVFRPAAVFSIDTLRHFTATDGTKPWEALPAFLTLPTADWTKAHEDGALSLIPHLVAAFSARFEETLVKSPHVARDGLGVIIRMPDPAQQIGEEDCMLANRLSSFFHEITHWTGFGGAGEALTRNMTGAFGSLTYAREELVAECTASRIIQILGFEETPGILAKKAAYVGGWAKPLLAEDADCEGLLRGVMEDVERVVARIVEAATGNPYFDQRLAAIQELERANRIPEASERMHTEIPDWRDADGVDALTPAQIERARTSFEAKKAKGAAAASGSFDDFIRHGQNKRTRRTAQHQSIAVAA